MRGSASLIERADMAEELASGMALFLAETKAELVSIWNSECDHFEGDARIRLQDIYADRLRQFAPMQSAG
jgi:hypothetical protein